MPWDTAVQVCRNCKRRKKKCDKAIPCCATCQRLHVKCHYDDPTRAPSKWDELEKLRSRLATIESHVMGNRSNGSSSPSQSSSFATEPTLSSTTTSLSTLSKYITRQALGSHTLSCPVDHAQFRDHVRELFWASSDSAFDVCDTYFEKVHHWLPIIPKRTLYDPLTNSLATLPAHISLLLLCMHLINQVPGHDAQWSNQQTSLYMTARTTYAQAQMILPASSELIQAGLLIATFEHSHALRSAAYLSVGSCLRTAYILGLHKVGRETRSSHASIKDAEDRNLWWGCIIRENFLSLEDISSKRPFTPQQMKSIDILPLEAEDLDGLYNDPDTPVTPKPVSMGPSPCIRSFGREAQSTQLTTEVLDLVTADPLPEDERRRAVQSLSIVLQDFLRLVMHQAVGTWGQYCGAMNTTIGALFVLHRWELSHYVSDAQQEMTDDAAISALALSTLTKLAVDVSSAFNNTTDQLDINALPVTSSYAVFQAALFLVDYGSKDLYQKQNRADWLADLKSLRLTLWHFSQRWKIADDYLDHLDKLTPVPMERFGHYIRPGGKLPGIC